MKTESLVISKHSSGHVKFTSLIISIRHVGQTECEVVIGNPGLPNVTRKMENGDAVLYETTQDGIIEVRMVGLNFMSDTAKFLVSQVSPMARLLAGTLNTDPNNSPFNEAELAQIAESIANAKVELRKISNLVPEQLELLGRKLDEIQVAAQRMGRKDWINYVAGSLTSVCISAAFAPEITKSIFQAVNVAFVWLFTNGILLLQ